jgi:hypothetical protein
MVLLINSLVSLIETSSLLSLKSIKKQIEAKGVREEKILANSEELREILKQVQNDVL